MRKENPLMREPGGDVPLAEILGALVQQPSERWTSFKRQEVKQSTNDAPQAFDINGFETDLTDQQGTTVRFQLIEKSPRATTSEPVRRGGETYFLKIFDPAHEDNAKTVSLPVFDKPKEKRKIDRYENAEAIVRWPIIQQGLELYQRLKSDHRSLRESGNRERATLIANAMRSLKV